MYVTEAELRDQLRRPRFGAEVAIPAGARLTPSAADFVNQWRLVRVEPHQPATPPRAESDPGSQEGRFPETPDHDWDKASEFPVDFEGERPRCVTCGTSVVHKASQLTQLNAHHYALKSHPRIKLRGRVDSLHALTLMAGRVARRLGEEQTAEGLATLAAYCRELTSAEYHERPVAELLLKRWTVEQIHDVTHDPREALGIEHLTIDDTDTELQHWLNMARTMSREIEITAMEVFPSPHHPYGASICHSLNRLSSAYYFLQLRLKAGKHDD